MVAVQPEKIQRLISHFFRVPRHIRPVNDSIRSCFLMIECVLCRHVAVQREIRAQRSEFIALSHIFGRSPLAATLCTLFSHFAVTPCPSRLPFWKEGSQRDLMIGRSHSESVVVRNPPPATDQTCEKVRPCGALWAPILRSTNLWLRKAW